jgi:hypothetical protein
MLVRRGLKGGLPLVAAARRLQEEILSPGVAGATEDEGLQAELRAVAAFKKVALAVLGTAMQTYGEKLSDEQEVLSCAADILIDVYAGESAVIRAEAARLAGRSDADLHAAAARVYVNDAAGRVESAARNAFAAMAEGDTLRTLLAALRRILKVTPVNTVALRRQLAEAVTAKGGYILYS